jgi:hypothetical protein
MDITLIRKRERESVLYIYRERERDDVMVAGAERDVLPSVCQHYPGSSVRYNKENHDG